MSTSTRPRFVPPPYQDSAESGRLILRDGTTADIHPATAADTAAIAGFFSHLAMESRQRRFRAAQLPSESLMGELVADGDPHIGQTLLATRNSEGGKRVIALGSYRARNEKTAEVSFAVAKEFNGKGLGAVLLERLALIAARNGFTRFWAQPTADDPLILEVFRASGFDVRERSAGSEVELEMDVSPTGASVSQLETRDRTATVASMLPFFRPRSVAVVGASRKESGIGRRVLDCMLGAKFSGPIYPVNPQAETLAGQKTYSKVSGIGKPVDLAVIAVPAAAVLAVVDDCALSGVRALAVISGGFAEMGPEGAALQKALVAKVRGYGMRMVGPNCLGLINADPAVRLNATFSPAFPPSGSVALSSQSGAIGMAALAAAEKYGLGISTFISVGNKGDVSGNDLLQYWEEDPGTEVILLYMESFGNPRRFARIARRVGQRKPVVMLQSGMMRTGGHFYGKSISAAETGATAVDALFRQTGMVRAHSLQEMFDLALALSNQPLPRGKRVAIVTNAGGPGILCADTCEEGGLAIAAPSSELKSRLRTLLPRAASINNPINLFAGAGASEFRSAIETLMASGEVDSLIAIFVPAGQASTEEVSRAIGEAVLAGRAVGADPIPVLACFLGVGERPTHLQAGAESIPCYPFPEEPARVLGKVSSYAAWRAQPLEMFPDLRDLNLIEAKGVCVKALADRGAGWLSADEVRAVLKAVKLPQVPTILSRTAEQAVEAANQLGYPVVVKLASRQLVHKTEVGGVCLGLTDGDAVQRACIEIRGNLAMENRLEAMEGVLVQPMVSGGFELMVGVTLDPHYGPLIAFGLGGIHAEITADLAFRVAPLSDRDASEMVRSLRGYRLLEGFRGHPPADVAAIEELLLRISRLVEEVPEICEIDLNPILAFGPGEGCRIADARIRVQSVQ